MIVAFDAGMLSILIHPDATIPDDPLTGKPLTAAKERIEQLVESIEIRNGTIIIPTPALSEFLVVVDSAGANYLRVLRTHACFDVQPFDERAAIECAESQRAAFAIGDKKSGAMGSFQKSKVDRQIVAIAKCWQVEQIYTTDNDVVKIAKAMNVRATTIWNLPLALSDPETEKATETLSAGTLVDEERRAPLLVAAEADEEATSVPSASGQPSGLSVFVSPEIKPDSGPDRPSGPQAGQAPPQPDSSPAAPPPPRSEK